MQLPSVADAVRALSFSPGLQKYLGGVSDSRLLKERPELPGGTPISLCKESSPNDIFRVTSVELTKQPLYFDDDFLLNIYGTFQSTETWTENATLTWRADCGSHCEMYGNPPGETPSESIDWNFCEIHDIMQPTGGEKRNATCPPVNGWALATTIVYIFPLWLREPAWYNITFDAKTADGRRIYCLTAEVCLRWEDKMKERPYPKGPWSNCTWPR